MGLTEQKLKQEFATYSKQNLNEEGFFQVLERFREAKEMESRNLYENAHITKPYFYKLKDYKHPNIAKEKVIAFGLALKLNRQEMDELLLSAGFALSTHFKFDCAAIFCIDHQLYNINKIKRLIPEQRPHKSLTRKTGTEVEDTEPAEEPAYNFDSENVESVVTILENLAERLEDISDTSFTTDEANEEFDEERSEALEEAFDDDLDEEFKTLVTMITNPIIQTLTDLSNAFDEASDNLMDIT